MVKESDLHPVAVCVKASFAVPADCPVITNPPDPIVTIPDGVAVHVPPENGVSDVVDPIHTDGVPVSTTVGGGFTVTGLVVD